MPVFVDKISSDKIAEQKIEIAALKAQIANPEIQKQDEPKQDEPTAPASNPVGTPKPAPKLEDKPESKPEPVSVLDAKRAELKKDRRVLSLIYASLEAGQSRSDCRKEMTKIDCRLKALG
jgi:hypothetical protein